MKKYAWVVLVLGFMACGGPPAFAGQLNLIWDQDFTNDTPCQTATQNSCLFEFIAYHTAASGRVTDFVLPAPPTAAGVVTGLQTGFFTTKNQYGLNSYCVISVAKDANGVLVESNPACVGAQLLPGSPSNVRYQTK
jgi:hypothetical protein